MNPNQRIVIHALRHPDVGADARNRLLGHSDVPLSEIGETQAREAARALASRLETDSVGLVHTSDLARCSRLASFIAEELGSECLPDPRLRAQHVGDWTGKTGEEIRQGPREHLEHLNAQGASWAPPGGGESLIDVAKRCFTWYADAFGRCEGRDLVVVTHLSTLRVLIAKIVGLGFDNAIRIAPGPGSYNCLEADRHANGSLLSLGGVL